MRRGLTSPTDLRNFLTEHRAAITPFMAGLPGVSPRRRRIPGLRRDEIARLLGVDTQYYTDLERGLLGHAPDTRVQELLADVLALTRQERERLAELLEDSYPADRGRHAAPPSPAQPASPSLADQVRAAAAPSSEPLGGGQEPVPGTAQAPSSAQEAPGASRTGQVRSSAPGVGSSAPTGPAALPPLSPGPARSAAPGTQGPGTGSTGGSQQDSASTRQLLESFEMPAFLRSRSMNLLAANRPCRLLYAPVLEWGGRFNHQPNLLEFAFLDEQTARGFWPDWEAVTARALADLRAAVDTHPEDADLLGVVGNLTARSRAFCRMWLDEGLPRRSSHGEETIFNPFIGQVTLPFRMLEEDDGAQVVVYTPSPGSAAHSAMQRLEVWACAG
ncbi:MmyB family transcriptional regulator [Actinomyces howellii]|uniref:MmyB-like transcription regulator ligand binding domain-containing protein n=1 Tax=Actinomyces howellii TaxID=52771 RepID=A0A3S4RV15_9ACTO|nr:helix-turn-helix domain-containing protein [Actinomyces howellii]VEG25796.1 Uncharacterised protein [Actinomyces howellii]